MYVATQEPHFQAHHEIWGRTATLIGRAFHGLPGFFELPLQYILSLLELVDIGVGCTGWGIRGRGQEGHLGMEAIIGKKNGVREVAQCLEL